MTKNRRIYEQNYASCRTASCLLPIVIQPASISVFYVLGIGVSVKVKRVWARLQTPLLVIWITSKQRNISYYYYTRNLAIQSLHQSILTRARIETEGLNTSNTSYGNQNFKHPGKLPLLPSWTAFFFFFLKKKSIILIIGRVLFSLKVDFGRRRCCAFCTS